jgi:hypothetical protein
VDLLDEVKRMVDTEGQTVGQLSGWEQETRVMMCQGHKADISQARPNNKQASHN